MSTSLVLYHSNPSSGWMSVVSQALSCLLLLCIVEISHLVLLSCPAAQLFISLHFLHKWPLDTEKEVGFYVHKPHKSQLPFKMGRLVGYVRYYFCWTDVTFSMRVELASTWFTQISVFVHVFTCQMYFQVSGCVFLTAHLTLLMHDLRDFLVELRLCARITVISVWELHLVLTCLRQCIN